MTTSAPSQHDPAVVNRTAWASVADKLALEGWSDQGELGALLAVADTVRGGAILDLGVGAGRTVALLRLLSADYVAIDYTPEMVDLCRLRHPGVDVRQGDARELIGIADNSVRLVCFSHNGIDAVDHADRQRVLAEVARVLRPDGRAVLSTLNLDGPLYGCDPSNAPTMPWLPGSLVPLAEGIPPPPDDGRIGRAVANWRRLRRLAVTGDGWAVAALPAHEFGLLTHFTTLEHACAEFAAHGLDVLSVFAAESCLQLPVGAKTASPYLHLVASRS